LGGSPAMPRCGGGWARPGGRGPRIASMRRRWSGGRSICWGCRSKVPR
jgi:hypothetical protein